MSEPSLPRLAFVYSGLHTEDPPLLLAEAARGLVSLLWVLPDAGAVSTAALRMLRRLGDVVEAQRSSPEQTAHLVRQRGAAGVACFNDDNLVWSARLAASLGCAFVGPESALRLTDKLEQRRALRSAGLSTPAFWDADALHDEAAVEEVERTAGFPVVLKPRRGHASRDVEAIRSRSQLIDVVAAAAPGQMLVEGYIPDPSERAWALRGAPYVSVELLASRGAISVLGVTGRAPLAPPFRETGAVFPAELPEGLDDAVVSTAVAAARALGVDTGPLHVEVKVTEDGPVVIEVNGVMGGGAIRDLMQRGLGLDVVELSMRLAVGEHIEFDRPNRPRDVGFVFELQPEASARRIAAVEGLDRVPHVPGVERVITGLGPGDEVSWRDGTHAFVAAVLGAAPDHATAYRIRDEFHRLVTVTTEGGTGGAAKAP